MRVVDNFKNWYRNLPEKKRYIEFVSALLTIPVLTTVILLNFNNLKNKENSSAGNESKVTIVPIQIPQTSESSTATPTASPTNQTNEKPITTECKKKVGPVTILSPQEGKTYTNEPVCIDISHDTGEYCSVVWSYRINLDPWSDFTDKSVCLYNLTPGAKQLEVKVKSIVSTSEKVLKLNFTIAGSLTPSPTATASGQTSH